MRAAADGECAARVGGTRKGAGARGSASVGGGALACVAEGHTMTAAARNRKGAGRAARWKRVRRGWARPPPPRGGPVPHGVPGGGGTRRRKPQRCGRRGRAADAAGGGGGDRRRSATTGGGGRQPPRHARERASGGFVCLYGGLGGLGRRDRGRAGRLSTALPRLNVRPRVAALPAHAHNSVRRQFRTSSADQHRQLLSRNAAAPLKSVFIAQNSLF